MTAPQAPAEALFMADSVHNQAPPGTREGGMVVLETDAAGKPTIWCDPEIVDLVRALNVGGLRTVASCSGHGGPFGIVTLKDGRELLVLPDFDTTRKAERILGAALVAESQGGGEVVAWHVMHEDGWGHLMEAGLVDDRFRGALAEAGRRARPLVYGDTAPQTSPVEVEAFDEWYASYDGFGGPKNPQQLARDAWDRSAALAQQPAASLQEQANALGYTMVENSALARLERRAQTAMACERGELWYWQGDGADFPESLSCPVVMHANALRDLLAAPQPAAVDGVNEHRWNELCRQIDAGEFPVGILDDALNLGSGALQLHVDEALAAPQHLAEAQALATVELCRAALDEAADEAAIDLAWRAATAACCDPSQNHKYTAPVTPEDWSRALRAALTALAQRPAAVDGPYRMVGDVVTVNGIPLGEVVKLGGEYAARIEKRGMPRAAQVFEALVMIGRHALAVQPGGDRG